MRKKNAMSIVRISSLPESKKGSRAKRGGKKTMTGAEREVDGHFMTSRFLALIFRHVLRFLIACVMRSLRLSRQKVLSRFVLWRHSEKLENQPGAMQIKQISLHIHSSP